MEFYQELLVTAVISILIFFLIGKLAAPGSDTDTDTDDLSDPAGEHPAVGGGAVPARDKRVVREESAGHVGRAAEVLGSGKIAADEAGGGGGGGVLEERTRETVEIEQVDAPLAPDEGGSAGYGDDVQIVPLPEEKECEGELMEEQKSGDDERPEKVGSLLHGEDEWEGIERNELEKLFAVATAYVGSASGSVAVSGLGSDLQLQLYGLHKVATEGPCYESQPLALKVSARAKWHAWQRLGNMNPEVAMEQYISLLSHTIPAWMVETPGGDAKQYEGNDPPEEGVVGTGTPDSGSSLHSKPSTKVERELKDSSSTKGGNSSAGPELSGKELAKTFFLNLLSPTTVKFLSFYL